MDLTELLTTYYDRWCRKDIEGLLATFTEGATFEDLAFAAKFEGRDQIRGFIDLTYAGCPDFQVMPTRVVAGDGAAAAAWVMSGTHAGDYPGLPATGKRFEVRASSIVEFDGDRIAAIVDYWNPLEFRRSVGLD